MAIERNVENKKKQTHLDLCILEACEKGDKEAVRKLLNQGASCRAQRNGCRAIHVALRHGHPGCAKILISHGAIINEANRYGDTALIIASARGDVTGVKILMEAGADPSIHNKVKEKILNLQHKDLVHEHQKFQWMQSTDTFRFQ